jgi:hypothetical protein
VRRLRSACALAIILATTLAGCSPLYFDWDSRTIRTAPTEQAATTGTPSSSISTHHQTASIHKRKHTPPTAAPDSEDSDLDTPETPAVSPQTPVMLPPTSTLSMASSGDLSGSATKTIDATRQRLARYDRNRLSGSTLATYDEANGFLNQSNQALAEKDYVAASGFAQKASVLADKLQATVTPR